MASEGGIAALIDEAPEHLGGMIRFSLATGLRQANVAGMQWNQIDLDKRIAWIHHDQAKAGGIYQCDLIMMQ